MARIKVIHTKPAYYKKQVDAVSADPHNARNIYRANVKPWIVKIRPGMYPEYSERGNKPQPVKRLYPRPHLIFKTLLKSSHCLAVIFSAEYFLIAAAL